MSHELALRSETHLARLLAQEFIIRNKRGTSFNEQLSFFPTLGPMLFQEIENKVNKPSSLSTLGLETWLL